MNSRRIFALTVLAIALALGARLRFHRLTLTDMNGDEGFSWAEASAPNLRAVIRSQQTLDPGKLALYEVLLHGWIRAFGDGLFSMRALSAGLGTLSIPLLFAAVREICICLADEPSEELAEVAGAFAALIFATNMRMVLESRLVRMYPLMIAAELLQILFFVRAQRRSGFSNYIGVAIFTALMIGANFSAVFLLAAEGLWLAALLLCRWAGSRIGGLAIFRPGFAIAAGVGLLVPSLLAGAGASGAHAVASGVYSWIQRQPVTWPYTVLRDAAGSPALFRIFIALGAFGTWWQWNRARLVSLFIVVWMAAPLLTVVAVTYLIHSLEFYRYVLIAFVGLYALAALGAASLPTTVVSVALGLLLVDLANGPTHYAIRHPYEVSWHKAVAEAVMQTAPGEPIAVFPNYCDNVVRYYVEPARRSDVHGVSSCNSRASVLLLTGKEITPQAKIAAMEKCYPHLIKRLFLIDVRSR